ncbi:putative RNA helicase [Vibrio chagasii]|nr:putative RNA helicase [Vibrio chagasii]
MSCVMNKVEIKKILKGELKTKVSVRENIYAELGFTNAKGSEGNRRASEMLARSQFPKIIRLSEWRAVGSPRSAWKIQEYVKSTRGSVPNLFILKPDIDDAKKFITEPLIEERWKSVNASQLLRIGSLHKYLKTINESLVNHDIIEALWLLCKDTPLSKLGDNLYDKALNVCLIRKKIEADSPELESALTYTPNRFNHAELGIHLRCSKSTTYESVKSYFLGVNSSYSKLVEQVKLHSNLHMQFNDKSKLVRLSCVDSSNQNSEKYSEFTLGDIDKISSKILDFSLYEGGRLSYVFQGLFVDHKSLAVILDELSRQKALQAMVIDEVNALPNVVKRFISVGSGSVCFTIYIPVGLTNKGRVRFYKRVCSLDYLNSEFKGLLSSWLMVLASDSFSNVYNMSTKGALIDKSKAALTDAHPSEVGLTTALCEGLSDKYIPLSGGTPALFFTRSKWCGWWFKEGGSHLDYYKGGKLFASVDFGRVLSATYLRKVVPYINGLSLNKEIFITKAELVKATIIDRGETLFVPPFGVSSIGEHRLCLKLGGSKKPISLRLNVTLDFKASCGEIEQLKGALKGAEDLVTAEQQRKAIGKTLFNEAVKYCSFDDALTSIEGIIVSLREKVNGKSAGYLSKVLRGDKTYDEILPAKGLSPVVEVFVGETNSGKTYKAIKALVAELESAPWKEGVILSPLRALAMQIQDDISLDGIYSDAPMPCSLVTGEEMSIQDGAQFSSRTVESYDPYTFTDTIVIDEAQLLQTDRSPAYLIALMGGYANRLLVTVAPDGLEHLMSIVNKWVGASDVIVHKCDRLSKLSVEDKLVKLDHVRRGDCVVAFSRSDIFNIASSLKSRGFKVCMLYGGMSPRARREMLRAAKLGLDFDVIVATDAIAMGLNLPIDRVLFYSMEKFDGVTYRTLFHYELRQIAGRAGRHHKNGLVGVIDNRGRFNNPIESLRVVKSAVTSLGGKSKGVAKANAIKPFYFEIKTLVESGFTLPTSLRVWKKTVDKPFTVCARTLDEMQCKVDYIFKYGKSLTLNQQIGLLFVTFPMGGKKCELNSFVDDIRRLSKGEQLIVIDREQAGRSLTNLERVNSEIGRWSQISRIVPELCLQVEIEGLQIEFGEMLFNALIQRFAVANNAAT